MQERVTWTPRHVWTDPRSSTVCIEWDAEVKLRGGSVIAIHEVAIHHIKNDKIVEERFYYNPGSMTPTGDVPAA